MIIFSFVLWILYFQLKKKIATQGLEPVADTSAALELEEEEDDEETSGTTTPTPRGPSKLPAPHFFMSSLEGQD